MIRSTLALVAALVCTRSANAAPLFTVTNTNGPSLVNPPFTLGFAFTPTVSGSITALGFFDGDQDGLIDSHQVGLFNSGGTLLASATVPAGTGAPLTNQFRYVPIAPVNLTAGQQYFLGGLFLTGSDPVLAPGFTSGFATAPGINFNFASFAFGGTLAAPTTNNGTAPGFFGPNALFEVPEPATLVVFGGIALAGAFGYRRRKASV